MISSGKILQVQKETILIHAIHPHVKIISVERCT
jgi:hypothetical protein